MTQFITHQQFQSLVLSFKLSSAYFPIFYCPLFARLTLLGLFLIYVCNYDSVF